MRIGIDVSQLVYPGGVSVYTKNLIENLLKIDQTNQYYFIGFSFRQKQVLEDWFKKLNFKNIKQCFFAIPITIVELLFNHLRKPPIEFFTKNLDLMHTSDWLEPKSNCLKITTVHDLAPLIYPQYHHPKIVNVFRKKLQLVKKESALIISVSQSTKKDLVRLMGIKEDKIKVIYEAPNHDLVQAIPDVSWFKKLNLGKFIISDAIRNPRKNLNNLLQALTGLQDKSLRLVLIGQAGWGEKNIYQLINSSATKVMIKTIPNCSPGQLKVLYQKALGAVFPSFYEGFGLSILEAMSCGCPVITSNVSSLPEIAGKAALLIDPHHAQEINKAINELSKNLSLQASLREEGYKQVKKFSWEKTAQATLDAYKFIFKSKL